MRITNVLHSATSIKLAISELAYKLNEKYAETTREEPVVICVVLKGAIPFYAHLACELTFPHVLGLAHVSTFSEDGSERKPEPTVEALDLPEAKGLDILVLDDICDTGKSLAVVVECLKVFQPKSIQTATLLYNNVENCKVFEPTYTCLQTFGHFVYGFGMDSEKGLDRNDKHIRILL